MREELIEIFKDELPGFDAHQLMLPIKNEAAKRTFSSDKIYKDSGVAILLFQNRGNLNTILIERTAYEGAHSGQISFPGGKREDPDRTLEHTARRECSEEINQDMSSAVLIKKLSDVYIPVSNFRVSPYVFWIDDLSELEAETREVHRIIEVESTLLTNIEVMKTTDMKFGDGLTRKDIPYFDINGHVVWGATAMILAELRYFLLKIN